MTSSKLEELISKYANGNATDEEVRYLMNWYRNQSVEEVNWQAEDLQEEQQVYQRILRRLVNNMSPQKARISRLRWMKAAAILVIFLGLASIITLLNPFSKNY